MKYIQEIHLESHEYQCIPVEQSVRELILDIIMSIERQFVDIQICSTEWIACLSEKLSADEKVWSRAIAFRQ